MDLETEILDKLNDSSDNFIARASQELKRAQRYLDFVSCLSVDASHLDQTDFRDADFETEFYHKLRRHIRKSIRQTDIISGFSNGKVCVLLVDTPTEGAGMVGQRLQESIRYFIHEIINSPKNWKVDIKSSSFPGNTLTPNSFLDEIRSILGK
jgi:GGDEF domain-containing protein